MLFFFRLPRPSCSTLFPYTSSSDLICTTDCNPGRVTPGNALVLTHLGVSREVYIAYILTITLLTSLVCLTVGAIIFWRKRSEEHTSELQSLTNLVCRLLLEKKK